MLVLYLEFCSEALDSVAERLVFEFVKSRRPWTTRRIACMMRSRVGQLSATGFSVTIVLIVSALVN